MFLKYIAQSILFPMILYGFFCCFIVFLNNVRNRNQFVFKKNCSPAIKGEY